MEAGTGARRELLDLGVTGNERERMRVAFRRSEFAERLRVVARVVAFSALSYAFFTIGVLLSLSDGMVPSGPPSTMSRVGTAVYTAFALPVELLKLAVGGDPAIREYRQVAFASNFVCYGILFEFVWRRCRATYLKRSRQAEPLCGVCGYNLTGNMSGKCPECGTIIPSSSS